MKTLKLKRGEERRLRRGHLWVYSNEVADSITDYEPGEAVTVLDANGGAVGSGTVNPHSLIAVRLHSRKPEIELNVSELRARISAASNLRTRLGFGDVCRLLHAEGDGLPGLILDRFGEVIIVQHTSAGIEKRRMEIRSILQELFAPKLIVEADDAPAREHEGMPLRREVIGELNEEVVWVEHKGMMLPIDLAKGQKTGGYLDQLGNQQRLAGFAKGARILDLFSYIGGFGLSAAKAGAKEVHLVDRSSRVLELAVDSFARSETLTPSTHTFDLLHMEGKEAPFQPDAPFDIVVCDPPPLVRNKRNLAEGMKAYEKLFARSMKWTAPGGLLVLFSCSHAVREGEFAEILRRSERRAGRTVQKLETFSAGMDHPVAVSHPETEYLRGVLLRVG